MTMYCIRKLLFLFGILCFNEIIAQDDLTGYFQPKIALNYKVAANYKHNFAIAQRTYVFEDKTITFRIRQIDLVHFSTLKIRDDQSMALGIQYRFRENFESDKHNELRLTQQYNVTKKAKFIRYGHRLRSEQRITSSLTIHRFRYRFSLDFPLQGEQLDIGESYLVGNLETLLSIAKKNTPQYDQRFTMNIGWLLREKTKLQTGLEYRFEDYTHKTSNLFFVLTSLILTL